MDRSIDLSQFDFLLVIIVRGTYLICYLQACKVSCLATMMNSSCGCVMVEFKYDDKPVCKGDKESVGKPMTGPVRLRGIN